MKGLIKRISDCKYGTLITSMLISIVASAFIGLICWVFVPSTNYLNWWFAMFVVFGVPAVLYGILHDILKTPENLCWTFSLCIYYGGIFLGYILERIGILASVKATNRAIVGAVIVSLVCYIVYLKNYKE